MKRIVTSPRGLALSLIVFSIIPIGFAITRVIQVPLGVLPEDASKYLAVPWSLFLHSLGGAAFGLIGPIQFAGVLKRRFGTLHKVLGRIFVIAGVFLALSSVRLLVEFPGTSTPVLDIARGLASVWVLIALWIAVSAVRGGRIAKHRAWMIRAYAVGMGASTVAILLFPIFLMTGEEINGLASDLVFVASWVINIVIAEAVIARIKRKGAQRAVTA